jgi:hypothetical protein
MKKSEQIIKEINERAEKPMVTAKFGDNWKEHQKRMFLEGQISIEHIIEIAWIQGRRSLLLEKELGSLIDI